MALSLNDKKVKRSALGQVKQHLPKKTAVMPWQDISPSLNESEKAGAGASSLSINEELEPNLSQTAAKLEPKPKRGASRSLDQKGVPLENLSQTAAKLESNLSQTAAKLEPSTFSDATLHDKKYGKGNRDVALPGPEQKLKSNLSQTAAKLEPKIALEVPSRETAKLEPNLSQVKAQLRPNTSSGPRAKRTDELEPNLSQTAAKLEPRMTADLPGAGEIKLEPNLSQTAAKLKPKAQANAQSTEESELEPNCGQTAAKLESKAQAIVQGIEESELEPNLSQTAANLESKLPADLLNPEEAKLEPNLSQTKAKLESANNTSSSKRTLEQDVGIMSFSAVDTSPFSLLVGLQRQVILFFYSAVSLPADCSTPPLSIQSIAHAVGTTLSSVRKAIQRLEEKGCVERAAFKEGRGGWTRYRLNAEIYRTLSFSQGKLSQT